MLADTATSAVRSTAAIRRAPCLVGPPTASGAGGDRSRED